MGFWQERVAAGPVLMTAGVATVGHAACGAGDRCRSDCNAISRCDRRGRLSWFLLGHAAHTVYYSDFVFRHYQCVERGAKVLAEAVTRNWMRRRALGGAFTVFLIYPQTCCRPPRRVSAGRLQRFHRANQRIRTGGAGYLLCIRPVSHRIGDLSHYARGTKRLSSPKFSPAVPVGLSAR